MGKRKTMGLGALKGAKLAMKTAGENAEKALTPKSPPKAKASPKTGNSGKSATGQGKI